MNEKHAQDFAYSFPAIRGVQAGREYYVTMCPLQHIPRLFAIPEDELPPEMRAQRVLNKSRVPLMSRYILENRNSYVFSSLTASIDGSVTFTPSATDSFGRKLGVLTVPMGARILINDGQHRRAAIEAALQEDAGLKNETISIVFFIDSGLSQSQQMFADLNRYAIRPTKSLGILYDHRDPLARLAHELADSVPVFKGMTEKAKSTISNRSRKLFTLSSIYQATKRLLNKPEGDHVLTQESAIAHTYWKEVGENMPDWQAAVARTVSPCELRSDYIHAHGIALQALAIAGTDLLAKYPKAWQKHLAIIQTIDWSRSNGQLWEGRALIGGRVNKAQNNIVLTANVIKNALGLSLTQSEKKVEDLFQESKRK
jgi:DNA sulfur modification protein DndB